MDHYLVTLYGFFGQKLYRQIAYAQSKNHALRMVAATHGDCFKNSTITLLEEQ